MHMMKSIIKRLKSKTYWLAILVAASAQLPLSKEFLAEYYGITSIVLAVAIAALREATKTPVNEK